MKQIPKRTMDRAIWYRWPLSTVLLAVLLVCAPPARTAAQITGSDSARSADGHGTALAVAPGARVTYRLAELGTRLEIRQRGARQAWLLGVGYILPYELKPDMIRPGEATVSVASRRYAEGNGRGWFHQYSFSVVLISWEGYPGHVDMHTDYGPGIETGGRIAVSRRFSIEIAAGLGLGLRDGLPNLWLSCSPVCSIGPGL